MRAKKEPNERDACRGRDVLDQDQGVGTIDHQNAWDRGTQDRRQGNKIKSKVNIRESESLFVLHLCSGFNKLGTRVFAKS